MLIFFFFNDTATTEIYTLSLHDALPISRSSMPIGAPIHTRRCSGTTSSFTCSPSRPSAASTRRLPSSSCHAPEQKIFPQKCLVPTNPRARRDLAVQLSQVGVRESTHVSTDRLLD